MMSFSKGQEEQTKSLEVALNASESTSHLPACSFQKLSEPSWTPSCSPPRFHQRTNAINSDMMSDEELVAQGQLENLPGVRFRCRQQHPGPRVLQSSEAAGQMRAAYPHHSEMSLDTNYKREEMFSKQLEPTVTIKECPKCMHSSHHHCAQHECLSQSSTESHQHLNPGTAGTMSGMHHCESEPSCAVFTERRSETALPSVDHDYCATEPVPNAVSQETIFHLSHSRPTAFTSQHMATEPSSALSHQDTNMNVERIWDIEFRADQASVTPGGIHTFYPSAISAHIEHLQHLQTMVLYLIQQLPQSTLTVVHSLVLSHLGDLNVIHLSNLTLFLMSQLENYLRYSHLLPVENILPAHVSWFLNLVSLNFNIVSAEVLSDEALLNLMESLGVDRTHNLTTAEIKQLPSYRFDPSNPKSRETQCVICLCQFEAQQLLCALPCNHVFHTQCLSKWLKIKRTCPVCRTDALMVQQES